MFRTLEDVANSTPKEYLKYAPNDPVKLAQMMINTASSKFPIINRDDGVERIQNYEFLYVGPGAGLVVKSIIESDHIAFGLETSKRGISMSPDETRSYVLWSKPWESPFPGRFTVNESGGQVPRKMFHVTVINKYLKELLTPEEWAETLVEMKRISKYVACLVP